MVIDSSAIIAILFRETEADDFIEIIDFAPYSQMTAASFVETSIVIEARLGSAGIEKLDEFLSTAEVEIVSFTAEQAITARKAYQTFGKGRHPAGLNLGDTFSYALAKLTDQPLLFKGDDFTKTDLRLATSLH